MSYKFNRNCWVESLEESLFCARECRSESEDAKTGEESFQPGGIQTGNARRFEALGPAAIEEQIASAERLFTRWGDAMKREEHICRLLDRLERNFENSRQSMHEFGIVQACARCDASAPEGSCCSRGLERKYSPILLVMNLLLGAGLPRRRLRADSCYFLGLNGCGLKVRHMLCIDYLCPEVEEALGRESLMKIQAVSGEEIMSAFLLQEAIKALITKFVQ